jgi:hypothetical protein
VRGEAHIARRAGERASEARDRTKAERRPQIFVTPFSYLTFVLFIYLKIKLQEIYLVVGDFEPGRYA